MARVTVLMPTYNVEKYVREAIESVLRQTFTDFELLVMDDCSTDGTLEVVRSIRDPRIRIEQNPSNLGLSDNLNRGLSLITTDLVARMDGDDIAEPFWLQREVEVLDNQPEIGICSGGFERFGSQQSLVRFPEHHEDGLANMLFECTVIVPTFRMSLYRDHGLRYSTDAFPAEDYRFWAECLRVTKLYNIQETLFHYRMHPTQICTEKRVVQQEKVAQVRLYMLEWLSDRFSKEEKHYYIRQFTRKEIDTRADLEERKAFAQKMIALNRSVGHFNETALRRRLDKHLTLSLYDTVVTRFFSDGYSLPKYLRYLRSGLALRTGRHYETKFLLKSLLMKKI
ncbi:MAG: glycosyltransferase family 2 protein [Bacteroidales bacterium]|nr:glycosyltransferase family 2 protein [Bacteroidales bacterium]